MIFNLNDQRAPLAKKKKNSRFPSQSGFTHCGKNQQMQGSQQHCSTQKDCKNECREGMSSNKFNHWWVSSSQRRFITLAPWMRNARNIPEYRKSTAQLVFVFICMIESIDLYHLAEFMLFDHNVPLQP